MTTKQATNVIYAVTVRAGYFQCNSVEMKRRVKDPYRRAIGNEVSMRRCTSRINETSVNGLERA